MPQLLNVETATTVAHEQFHKLNNLFESLFGRRLSLPVIAVTSWVAPERNAEYHPATNEYKAMIFISWPHVYYGGGFKALLGSLIHEMVHHLLHEAGLPNSGHGPAFARVVNEIEVSEGSWKRVAANSKQAHTWPF